MVGAPITGYNGNLDSFIGPYRTYSNPIAVEQGKCNGEMNYNSNACGALQSDIVLQPGESRELIYILGQKDNAQANEILASYEAAGKVDQEVAVLARQAGQFPGTDAVRCVQQHDQRLERIPVLHHLYLVPCSLFRILRSAQRLRLS